MTKSPEFRAHTQRTSWGLSRRLSAVGPADAEALVEELKRAIHKGTDEEKTAVRKILFIGVGKVTELLTHGGIAYGSGIILPFTDPSQFDQLPPGVRKQLNRQKIVSEKRSVWTSKDVHLSEDINVRPNHRVTLVAPGAIAHFVYEDKNPGIDLDNKVTSLPYLTDAVGKMYENLHTQLGVMPLVTLGTLTKSTFVHIADHYGKNAQKA